MPLPRDIGKAFPFLAGTEPLTSTQIKLVLLARDIDRLGTLASRWRTSSSVLSRVIHRRGEYVYMRERKLLARFLGVPIERVGREPNRESPKSRVAA